MAGLWYPRHVQLLAGKKVALAQIPKVLVLEGNSLLKEDLSSMSPRLPREDQGRVYMHIVGMADTYDFSSPSTFFFCSFIICDEAHESVNGHAALGDNNITVLIYGVFMTWQSQDEAVYVHDLHECSCNFLN